MGLFSNPSMLCPIVTTKCVFKWALVCTVQWGWEAKERDHFSSSWVRALLLDLFFLLPFSGAGLFYSLQAYLYACIYVHTYVHTHGRSLAVQCSCVCFAVVELDSPTCICHEWTLV